jgi:hypothetical protein
MGVAHTAVGGSCVGVGIDFIIGVMRDYLSHQKRAFYEYSNAVFEKMTSGMTSYPVDYSDII